jgi:glycosyltransferase involved in cell wall biosynthesis
VIRVSVCMAAFNGARFLRPQLDSILAQLRPDDELVISDDGSDDGTLDLIASYREPRLRVFFNSFRNVARNFEFALTRARGANIFLSDQDDEWIPGKVATMCARLESCDLVVSDCEVIDAEGRTLAPSYFALNGSRPGVFANLWRNGYLGCCMAFRRELMRRALPLPDRVPHDIWIGLIADLFGKAEFIDKPLVRFRRHEANASYAARESGRTVYQKVSSRIRIAAHLALRAIGSPTQ